MDTRRKIVLGFVLFVAGAAGGMLARPHVARWLLASAPVTTEQVRLDAIELLKLVNPDPRLPADLKDDAANFQAFWGTWDPRRARYSDAQLADLAQRLEHYLDFMQAEYADAAEIWRKGRPEHVREQSDAARALRSMIRDDFGEFGGTLIRQADEMREDAYRSSPAVASGEDETTTNYQEQYDALLTTWLPRARVRVQQLTARVEPK